MSRMMYSRSAQHAIRAMTYLSTLPPQTYCPVREVAKASRVPLPFLAKIIQALCRRGLVSTQKGPGGGVALARSPSRITLAEVVAAIDGREIMKECVLGLPRCGDASPCAMHSVWKEVKEVLRQRLQDATLAELSEPEGAPRERPRGPAQRRPASARRTR
jgi:Rrf2 family protein